MMKAEAHITNQKLTSRVTERLLKEPPYTDLKYEWLGRAEAQPFTSALNSTKWAHCKSCRFFRTVIHPT